MLYCWLGIIECVLIACLGYRLEKNFLLNPLTIFGLEWAIILLFSSMKLWTLIQPDDTIYLMILIGIMCFFLGYITFKGFFKNKKIRLCGFSNNHVKLVPRYYLIYVLSFFTIAYYIAWVINILKQIQSFDLGSIISIQRTDDFVGYDNRILNAAAVLLLRPMAVAIPAITAVDFWFGKRDKILFTLNLMLLIVRVLSSGGRTIILLFGLYFLACSIVYLRQNKLMSEKLFLAVRSKKIKRVIRRVVLLMIVAFSILTASRGVEIFQNVYIAFAIQPRMFEIWSDYVNKQEIVGGGITSLFGFIYPLFYLIKNLLGIRMPSFIENIFECINKTEIEWVWPGTGMRNNAYVSLFWYFYVDGRWFGIAVGMFLFGIIVAKNLHHVCMRQFDEKNMAIYCLTLYAIVFSFVRLEYGDYSFALAVVYIYFILYKRNLNASIIKEI